MTVVSATGRVNRPFFFTDTDGNRVEIPSFDRGQGDLEGGQLAEFRMYEQVGQIKPSGVQSAPVSTAAPVVTGVATVGGSLVSTTGSWSGSPAPTFSRQWQRGTTNITGATGATYTPVIADAGQALRVVVTATNSVGSATANSAATAAVTSAPANTVVPAISGTATVGQTLTVTNGTWTGSPAPTYTRQWRRGATNIANATGATYVLVTADEGQNITCAVTATNTAGNASATSNSVGPVAALPVAPVNTVAPLVTGGTQVGSTLTVTNGTWTGTPTPTYTRQWQRGSTVITGSTGATYTLVPADVGQLISCVVSASNAAGSDAVTSNTIGPVTAVPVVPANTAAPVISGTATQGQTLTATNGTWTGTPTPTYARQWRRGAADITNATGTTYVLAAADVGQNITCAVTATNSAGSNSATSNSIGPIVALPVAPVNTVAPAVTGTAETGSTLTTTNGTWTGTPVPTYTRAWQRSSDGTAGWVAIGGATATTYILTEADEENYIRCVVSGSNSAGASEGGSNVVGPITVPIGGT